MAGMTPDELIEMMASHFCLRSEDGCFSADDMYDYLIYRDEKGSGTNGGTFTLGAWRTRTLNTEVLDTGGHGTLAANQVTLAAGTYIIEASAPAHDTDSHQIRWYNVTDAAEECAGTSEYSGRSEVVTRSVITDTFTITSSKAFRLEHRAQTTQLNTGFGIACGWTTEVFAEVKLTKIA